MNLLAVDVESTGLYIHHGCRPFYVSTCSNKGWTKHWEWEVDVKTREVRIPDDEVDDVTEYINSFDQIVLHNAKFDWHALSLSGVKMPPWSRIHDTLLMSHCLDSAEPHGLKDLAAKYLDIPDDDQQNLKKVVDKARRIGKKLGWMIASPECPHLRPCNGKAPKSGWSVLDMWLPRAIVLYAPGELTPAELKLWPKVCGIYAETDVVRTIGLFNLFSEQLEEEGLWEQYEFQRSNLPSTAWMERRGVTIREKEVKDADKRIRIEATHHTESAIKIASAYLGNSNLNLNSPNQLQVLLYDNFRLPVIKRTDSGNPSCDFDTLLRLAFMAGEGSEGDAATFLRHLVHRNKLNKTLEFLKKYQANLHQGRIYPTFNLTGTSTTRMSSESPNAQNVGKGGAASGIDDPELQAFLEEVSKDNTSLRSIFGPRKGRVWYSLDYAQLQLRIFAFVSGEKDLIKAFDEGWDAHDYIAHRIFRLKDGQKPDKLQRRIGKNVNFGFIFGASPAKIEATAGRPGLYDEVTSMFPNAHKFMEATKRQVRKHKFVRTPGGYKLMCDQSHKGVNYIVQGAEGEIVKRAMVDCRRYLLKNCPQGYMTLQVHDELVFDMPESSVNPRDDAYFSMNGKTRRADYYDKWGHYRFGQWEHLKAIADIMAAAGDYYGMRTPVEAEIVQTSWDKGVKVK